MATVTRINVEFSNGSFAEWAEAAGDRYPATFIAQWEANYNEAITALLKEHYPDAEVEVSEGYDQLMYTKIDVEFDDDYESDDDFVDEADYQQDIEALIGTVDLDDVWDEPTVETIAQAIIDETDARPVAVIRYEGANFAFARHSGGIAWMDLDINDPLNPDDEWEYGDENEAAVEFRGEFDPDFKLITQSETAEKYGVSISAVNNAIRDGRLTPYREPGAPKHRPGSTLVNQAEAEKVWGAKPETN